MLFYFFFRAQLFGINGVPGFAYAQPPHSVRGWSKIKFTVSYAICTVDSEIKFSMTESINQPPLSLAVAKPLHAVAQLNRKNKHLNDKPFYAFA